MIQEQTQSEQINELLTALSKAQSKIECAIKDKKNPFFKSTYADLNSVWEACREHLTINGLSIIQTPVGTKEEMYLVTILGHSSGQWIKSYYPLTPVKQDPQAVGSAITYARRYSLSAMVGICADEDDDGEKAMQRTSGVKYDIKKETDVKKFNTETKNVKTEPVKNDNLPYLTDEESELYDKFISIIPEKERENSKQYIDAVCNTKHMRPIEVIKLFMNDMEKFKSNVKQYKENLKNKTTQAA